MIDGPEVLRRQPFGDNPEVGTRGASTQRSILASALDVFAEHGFHDTNVELISSAAGCSRPAFYQYFSSKDDVFWRLAGHLARDLAALVDGLETITPDATGLTVIEGWLDQLVDLFTTYQPIFGSFEAAFRGQAANQSLPRTIASLVVRTLEAAPRTTSSDLADVEFSSLGDATSAMILRSIHYWLAGLVSVDRVRFTTALALTVHRVLFGANPKVNLAPLTDAPSQARPKWPEIAESTETEALRPRGLQTRQELLDAGRDVLPRRGFHDARVDDIVSEAGCSHGTFYRYFQNKDELFQILALDAGQAMEDLVEAFPTGTDSLRPWMVDWFGAYRANGGILSAWQEIGVKDSAMTAMSLDLALVFFDRLERAVHARGFGDTTIDAVALLAVLEHVPYNVLVLRYLDEDQAIAAAECILRRGILGA